MEKRDRFLLEQKLMSCWHVTDDLKDIADFVGDSSDIPAQPKDRMVNMLLGMHELYHIKFEQTMNLFAELIANGTIDDRNNNGNVRRF